MPITIEKPKFINPYTPSSGKVMKQIMCPIYEDDVNFLRCVRPALGTTTTALGILLLKLKNELQSRNITDFSRRDDFEEFVSNCRLITAAEYDEYQALCAGRRRGLPDSTASGPMPEPRTPNDAGGTAQPCHGNTTITPVVPDLQGRSGKVGGGHRKSPRSTRASQAESNE